MSFVFYVVGWCIFERLNNNWWWFLGVGSVSPDPSNPWHQNWHQNSQSNQITTHSAIISTWVKVKFTASVMDVGKKEISVHPMQPALSPTVCQHKKTEPRSSTKGWAQTVPGHLWLRSPLASDMIYLSVTPKLQESSCASLQPCAECKCAFDTFLNRCHNSFPELLNLSLSPGTSTVFLSKNRAH